MAKDTLFISYARQNTDFMRKLKSRLEESGLKVWVDENIKGGTTWDNIIEEALETSDTIIVVLSEASVSSKMVMNEVSFGIEENKRVIPVMVEECKVPFRLRRIQYIDFHSQEFDTAIKRLFNALDREGITATIKADPIVAPTQPEMPQVATQTETPKAAQKIKPATVQPSQSKKGFPIWIYGILAVVVIGIAISFLLPSESEDPVTNNDLPKSKIAEKDNYIQDTANQHAAAQILVERDVVENTTTLDSVVVDSPTAAEIAWELALEENTVVSYVDFIRTNDVSEEEKVRAEEAMLAIFKETGYIQYSEKNGYTFFNKVYDIENEALKPNKGDVISLVTRRNIKAGVYGSQGFSRTLKVGEIMEEMIIKEVIPSGRAFWVKVGYNN